MSPSALETADIGDGRSLSYRLAGGHGPTVVLESGLGSSALEWDVVAPRLAETTSVLTYDRAGYGNSSPATSPHSAMQMADDCIRLLNLIGVPTPYLLVGHSWGGVVGRFVTDRIPERVGGLVLVDATHEALKMPSVMVRLLASNCRRQAKRAEAEAAPKKNSRRLQMLLATYPAATQAQFLSERTRPGFHRAAEAELKGLAESLRAAAALPPPRVPVVAITGTKTDSRLERRARAKMTQTYRQLAADWPSARHVLAPNSGHFVPQFDTDLLVEVVTAEIERCRAAAVQAG